ncbi:MAG: LLM class flavin-dependent oxidoreductase [Candidatus Promineifilaceae bacterium]
MEVGIAFQTNHPLADYGALAVQAEQYGFDVIALFNDLFYQPAWFPLMEMARQTDRIRIGSTAVNPFTSHPVNIAGHLALLNETAPGRIYLGLARGAGLDDVGIRPKRPLTALREAFAAVRQLLSGDEGGISAEQYPIPSGRSFHWQLPSEYIPFLLATWGAKTVKKCIRHIDEVKLGGSANPDAVRWMRDTIDQAAIDVGRDPAEIKLVIGLTTMVNEDSALAKQMARREVVSYLSFIADLDPTLDLDPELVAGINAATRQNDYARAASYVSDDLLEKFAVAGSPAEVTALTEAIFAAGADRVDFGTPHGETTSQGLQLLGEQVLPRLGVTR